MKKGFTLVELVATLVILSVIALIVTPNLLVSIREYKQQVYDNNILSIKSAAQSYLADNPQYLPEDNNTSLYIPISDLISEAHLDENIKDTINNGTFDDKDHNTFIIINANRIENQITGELINIKYDYSVYTNENNFIEEKAIEYVEKNTSKLGKDLIYTDLIDAKLIREIIKDKNGNYVLSSLSSKKFVVTQNDNDDYIVKFK